MAPAMMNRTAGAVSGPRHSISEPCRIVSTAKTAIVARIATSSSVVGNGPTCQRITYAGARAPARVAASNEYRYCLAANGAPMAAPARAGVFASYTRCEKPLDALPLGGFALKQNRLGSHP